MKNNFVSKQKVWRCTKKSCVDKNNLILLEKVFHVIKKKLMLHKKSISRRQKQDDGETKKYFVLKKFFPERRPIYLCWNLFLIKLHH